MEDNHRDMLGILHELVYLQEEAMRRRVVRPLDIATMPVIIANIDDTVVLPGNLVALDDRV